MKNHRYSTAGKIATVIIQQLMAVLLVVFLLLLGSLFSKSMLEFQDIGKGGFLDSGYFTQEFKSTTTEVQNLINLRKKFETNGEYDPSKAVTVTGDLQYRLGDLEAWAKEGCSYQAAGYLSLVEETYPAVNGGGYIERYLNGEISTQEATNISNAIENMMFSITKDIDTYKRLINKYDAGKSNVAYYYRSINGAVYTNLKLEEGGKEEARQKIEDLGQYLCYDDEDIHFDTNINNLEEYFYQDETYITGNMDTDAAVSYTHLTLPTTPYV